jgi:undecaprenyl-diphosphatase
MAMNYLDLGCQLLRAPILESLMVAVKYLGNASVGVVIGVLFWGYGFVRTSQRMKQVGLAILFSTICAGLLANVLKVTFGMPRPRGGGYGFPSGHTSVAFGLATALAHSFPQASPIFYLFSILTGISRLYHRAHFVWDVLGGVLVGTVAGTAITSRFVKRSEAGNFRFLRYAFWSFNITIALSAMIFFFFYEGSTRIYRLSESAIPEQEIKQTVYDFGTPEARKFFGRGWSAEDWTNGELTISYAVGTESSLMIPLPLSSTGYRFRFRLLAFAPPSCLCQRARIVINDYIAGRYLLEPGWYNYEFHVPRNKIKEGMNEIKFFFDYAATSQSKGIMGNDKTKRVGFDRLEILPES